MAETCKKCPKEPYFEGLCMKHFKEYVIKKVRKEIRAHELVQKHDTLVTDNELCKDVFEDVVQGLPHTLVERGDGKKLLFWTMDDEIEAFLDAYFSNDELPELGHPENAIKLFLPLRDVEVEAYAKMRDVEWHAPDRGGVGEMIESMRKDHPETQYAILSNLQELKKILREQGKKA